MLNFKRFYRYDFAVTQIFTDLNLMSKYYGVTISAHLLSYTPASVIQLLNETKKPFFTDPMTYVFARDMQNICRNGAIRRSFKKLMDDYGLPFSNCNIGNKLSPSQFKKNDGTPDISLILETAKNVLAFQQNKYGDGTTANLAKYAKVLKKSAVSTLSPEFLVAPYFFISDCSSEWYSLNIEFAKQSQALKGAFKLYPVICISKAILWDNRQIDQILTDYREFDGYLLWVNDLDEEAVDSYLLKGLKRLVSGLSVNGKQVISLYGGYLFDLLMKFGLTGYSSGICYGESKNVDAKGGGGAGGSRYYIPTVHVKISEDLANVFFAESEKNLRLICRCPICTQVHNKCPPPVDAKQYSDTFFSNLSFLDFRRHFLTVKFEEMNRLEGNSNPNVLDSLNKEIDTISNVDRIAGHPTQLNPDHLRSWRTLFE